MIPQRNDDHVAEGAALLTGQYRDKPVISGVLRALLASVQTLEEELWVLLWGWVLEHGTHHASGQQLDDLGAIVGQLREGRNDTDYLQAIRVRLRVLRSRGRSEDVLQVARMLNELATYVEYYPLGWEVSIYNVTNGGQLIRLLTQTKAASSYGVLLTSNWAEADALKFTHVGSTDHVGGSVYSPSAAAKEVAALPTNPAYRTQS